MQKFERHRRALFVIFALPGVLVATWASRTPAIRDALSASTAEMGIVMFGMSIGALCGVTTSGRLIGILGSRAVVAMASLIVVVGMVLIGLGAHFSVAAVVFCGFFSIGAGIGATEIAANMQAADLENTLRRSILPAMHGFFSGGMVLGAFVGIVASWMEIAVLLHLLAVATTAGIAFLLSLRDVPRDELSGQSTQKTGQSFRSLVQDRRLLMLGFVVLAAALAEGAANDWLPLILVDGHGFAAVWGSASFMAFASAMALGRFASPLILRRFSPVAVLRLSMLVAALGLGLVIFSPFKAIAGAAVILWGAGSAVGFPLALSIAGASSNHSEARVGFVAQIGYLAFLVGPPLLGFLGEHYGLRPAMLVVLFVLAAAAFCAGGARPAEGQGQESKAEKAA